MCAFIYFLFSDLSLSKSDELANKNKNTCNNNFMKIIEAKLGSAQLSSHDALLITIPIGSSFLNLRTKLSNFLNPFIAFNIYFVKKNKYLKR